MRHPPLTARAAALALLFSLSSLSAAAAPGEDRVDLATVHRIKAEAFRDGKVMDHLFWLTDANGPRLTNSPGFRTAADWCVRALRTWGASNARLEKWGTFGRGWSAQRSSVRLVQPLSAALVGVPKAWTGGTNGPVRGEVILAPLFQRSEASDRRDLVKLKAHIAQYMQDYRGRLRGKVVLFDTPRVLESPKDALSERYDEHKLASLLSAPEPLAAPHYEYPLASLPTDPKERMAFYANVPFEVLGEYGERLRKLYHPLWAFLRSEGAVAVLGTDDRGDGGLVFTESGGSWDPDAPVPPPVFALAPESYARVARLLSKKLPVQVEVDVQAQFHGESTDGLNVVAEIPGGTRKDEVVMLGAHLDSWHGGTGATDNAAGSAVMLEAFRILQALHLKMDRTVRIALWSGEEQGLLGSRGYVKQHFADPITMSVKPEHAKLSAYFNLDNGSGKVRGVYLQDNDAARPLFEQWLAPFRDLGVSTISIRNTGSTDHVSFDEVGLPGFQFIQDPLDYMTRTHHSDLDVAEHAQAPDLMQAAAVVASVVYDAATRKEMVPRKPLPSPLPTHRAKQE